MMRVPTVLSRRKRMDHAARALRVACAAVVASLLLTAGAHGALAHDRGTHASFAPVQGTVTLYSNGKLQLATGHGSVTIAVPAETHVMRVVSGSTADLHPNQFVDLHVVPGTTTVDVIRIVDAGPRPGRGSGRHRDGDGPALITNDAVISHGRILSGHAPNHVSGQVVAVTDSSITIRTPLGKSSYALSTSVVVHKTIAGSLDDLAEGEMVNVSRGRDGSAQVITIMTA